MHYNFLKQISELGREKIKTGNKKLRMTSKDTIPAIPCQRLTPKLSVAATAEESTPCSNIYDIQEIF